MDTSARDTLAAAPPDGDGWFRKVASRKAIGLILAAVLLTGSAAWLYYHYCAKTILRASTVTGMCWSPEGSQLAVAYGDGGMIIATYNTNAGWGTPARSIQTLLPSRRDALGQDPAPESCVVFPAWSADSRYIAGQCGDMVKVWDLSTMKEAATIPSPRALGSQPRLAWSPASGAAPGRLAVSDKENVLIWSPDTVPSGSSANNARPFWPRGFPVKLPSESMFNISRGLWWSPDGKMLAIRVPPYLYIFDVGMGTALLRISSSDLQDVAWKPDSSSIALLSSDLSVRSGIESFEVRTPERPQLSVHVWELPTQEMLRELGLSKDQPDQSRAETKWSRTPVQMAQPNAIFHLEKPGYSLVPNTATLRWSPDGKRISAALHYEQFNGPPPEIHRYSWTFPIDIPLPGSGVKTYTRSVWRIPRTLSDLGKQSYTLLLFSPAADKLAVSKFHSIYWQPEHSFGRFSTVTVQPAETSAVQ